MRGGHCDNGGDVRMRQEGSCDDPSHGVTHDDDGGISRVERKDIVNGS